MKEYAQKIIDYLRIEIEIRPGDSLSDLDEISKIIQEAVHAAEHRMHLTAFGAFMAGFALAWFIAQALFIYIGGGR